MSRVSPKVVDRNATDWVETTIGDQVLLQRGVDITRAEQRPGCVPVISSGGVSSFHDTPAATGPGVVLGRKGVVGSVYFVDTDYWPHDTTLWVKDFKGNLPRFVYYFFRGMTQHLTRLDVGSANPTLNRNHVHPIQVRWPPLPEQRAIAHVLGTLDDKIELNRKMSETLEELARTLFKSWFVDFDPVHAKAAGKKPFGMDDATAALFPDSFEDSELGPIPSGWRVAALGEVAALNPEQWTSRNHPPAIDYLDLSSASRGVFGTPSRMSWGDSPSRARRVLRDWDTAFGTVRPGNRSFGLVLSASEVLTGSTGFAVLRPDDERWRGFVYLCVTRDANVEYFSVVADGSAYPAVAQEVVHQTSCVLPDDDVVSCFQRVVEPMFLRIDAATSESRTLAELRDTLLPKLLSGELRVPLDVADAPSAKSEQLGLFGDR